MDVERRKSNLSDNRKKKPYGRRKTQSIQVVYLLGILIWLLIIVFLGLYTADLFGWIILIIPILVYVFSFVNARTLTVEVEENLFAVNYLSIAILIGIPIFMKLNKHEAKNRGCLARILVVAILLAVLSLVTLWVNPKWVSLVNHIKSALQTASLVLLVYALYVYYLDIFGPC